MRVIARIARNLESPRRTRALRAPWVALASSSSLMAERGDTFVFVHDREAEFFCVRRMLKLCAGSTCAITVGPM